MARGRAEGAARLLPNPTTEVAIPDKLYFRIGEVSELTQTKAYVLRYWETEFPTLRPVKSKSGHRLYRRKDVELIFEIRRLLYEKGFTLEGARKHLASADKNPPAQSQLFRSSLDVAELKAVRQELQTILTMLSRKC
jgi:DNA-binding transcriptional MerR regulator